MSESEKPPANEELGALERWSRRKSRAARGEVLEDEPAPVPESARPAAAEEAIALEPAEIEPTDADMPPIETLDAHSDLSGFFSPKVSEALRRQALRRYFHLPGVHIVDRMNEYDEDYRSFQPLGDLVPEEMKRKLANEAERLGRKLLDDGGESERTGHPDGDRPPEIASHAHDDKEADG